AWVVRGHTVTDQAERSGHALKQVDLDILVGLHQQIGCVDSGWASANNSDAQRARHRQFSFLKQWSTIPAAGQGWAPESEATGYSGFLITLHDTWFIYREGGDP